jgi:hypothetical protein
MDALLDPVIFFFIMGIASGLLKSDFKIPATIYEILSIYLLLAIGIKGGVALSKSNLLDLVYPFIGTMSVGIIIPFLAFAITFFVLRFSRDNAAALATHYGSVSAVTFAVCLNYLQSTKVGYESYATVMLVILEVPALVIGITLAKLGDSNFKSKIGKVLHEVLFGKSIFLLVGGLAIGYFAGPERIQPLAPVFFTPFKGALAFFLLEMGLVVSHRLGSLKKAGPKLILFAIVMPIISAAITCVIGSLCGLSLGSLIVLCALAASASYIAAPAAVRVAIPEANPALYLGASLAVTFPFNVVIGIPLYHKMAEFSLRILGS